MNPKTVRISAEVIDRIRQPHNAIGLSICKPETIRKLSERFPECPSKSALAGLKHNETGSIVPHCLRLKESNAKTQFSGMGQSQSNN